MSQENVGSNDLQKTVDRFLKINYFTSESDVDFVIEESEKNKTQYFSVVNYLVNNANSIAEYLGIVKDKDFPMTHLPTILAAVKELETDVNLEDKKITNKREIELLITGELTSARKNATSLRNYVEVGESAKRIVKLMDFRNVL